MINASHMPFCTLGIFAIFLSGCATINGAVTPMEGGEYKSFVSADSKKNAMRMVANDAKLTCKEAGKDGYIVVSQEEKQTGLGEITTGNNVLDKAISISKIGEATRKHTEYEIDTVFKCR